MALGGGKKGPAVDIVFGMGKPKGLQHGSSDNDDSRDMLIGALNDAGVEGDKADALADALHEYILSCTSGSEPDGDEG